MVSRKQSLVFRYLRRLAGAPPIGDENDEALLRRFVLHKDEDSFAALVEKHGPMVLGVCRRLLGHSHDAEDAFQATFLVLVRKARSVRQPGSLASWLYRVAYCTAIKARALASQRHFHETQAMAIQASRPIEETIPGDLKELLDEEINRLPARYRQPLVLCYLCGRTNEEAARELGCPAGTIFSRLARAREMLRGRLIKRGIALSSAGFATALSETVAKAAVSSALAEATITSAFALAAGKGLAAGALSASVYTLTKGVQQAMFMNTLKITLAITLGLGLAVTAVAGAGVALYAFSHDSRKDEKVPKKQATVSNENPDNKKLEEEKRKLEAEFILKRLLKEKMATAKEEVDARMKQFEAGKGTLDFLIAASKRLLNAEMEDKPDVGAQTPLQAHFERMKKIQDMEQQRFDDGRISIEDLALAKYYRLEAEIWLERAKTGKWQVERGNP